MTPIDEAEAIRLINDLHIRTGRCLEFVGLPTLGATDGAVFVRQPNGRPGVLSRSTRPKAELDKTAKILEHLRSHGVPAPRYCLITELSDCTVIVQERLPGEPTPRHIDREMMAQILSMAESFTGLLDGLSDVAPFQIVLQGPRTASLARHDDRSRRLLEWIRSVEAQAQPMSGTDLIHCDYHRDNILFDETGALTGIVDWHDAGSLRRGDRRYLLVHLAFDFAWALARRWNIIDTAAMQLLDEAIDAMDPALVDTYWAHDALQIVDNLLSHQWNVDADAIIDFALTRVPR